MEYITGDQHPSTSHKSLKMELYAVYFASLALFNTALAYNRNQESKADGRFVEEETLAPPKDLSKKEEARKFKITYFGVYVLVVAADWLQGPYMYTLYKDEKDEKALSESTTAALFTTGFVSAGITASFAGSLADKHGRRTACLTFCIAYSISCVSVLSSDLLVLFAGRALGGLSTTLLYSVFETWMVSEYHARDVGEWLSLGDMFSSSVTLSGLVAIVAGIAGEAVVRYTDTKVSPFLLAILCLWTAFGGIWHFWGENYGGIQQEKKANAPSIGLRATLPNSRIMALVLTTTVFEGSMYLFVFFWSPALKSSRAISGVKDSPPFGLIFSCFMCAMMLGSIVFSTLELRSERDTSRLLLSILAMAAVCLLIPVLANAEVVTFWSFALFETSIGLYFPTMSRLKSELVDDAIRGKVYGMMRLPLNLFVVLALGVTREGNAHRGMIFTVTGALLLSAFFVVQRWLL